MELDPSDLDADPRPLKPHLPQRIGVGRALAALGVGFVLAQLLGKLAAELARAVTHVNASSLSGAVVLPSMLASELALISVAVATPVSLGLPLAAALGLRAEQPRVYAAASLGTIMLGPIGDRLMTLFTKLFPGFTLGVVPALHDLAQHLPLVWLWPAFALLPGLGEELLFRGVLQRSIAAPRLAVAVSGLGFALFHVDPVHIVGVLPLGLFLAWVAQRSSTSVSIVAHVLNNSVALLSIRSEHLDVGFGSDRELPTSWLLASVVVFAAACALVARATPALGRESR